MDNERKEIFQDNIKWFGKQEGDCGFNLIIRGIILSEIESYLESDTSTELGGVLIGNCKTDENGTTVMIDDMIIAEHTESGLTKLTFTHETWIDINDKLEKNYQGKMITGWFHSHPGHGVFMSGYDKFIHENFFNAGCTVALVYDPLRRERGFFYFRNNEVAELKRYGVFDNGKPGLLQPVKLQDDADFSKQRKKINIKNILLFILTALTVILLLLIYDMRSEYQLLNKIINDQQKINDSLTSEINKLSELMNSLGNFGIKDTGDAVKYIVQPGDDLKSIAIRFYDNPAMYDTIIKFNNLKNELDIYPGKEILIP
jgi:proteasome lid subunit RPN8/RPN11/cell division protein FtsL